MAYTNLSAGNFTLTDSLLFTNYNLLSQQVETTPFAWYESKLLGY